MADKHETRSEQPIKDRKMMMIARMKQTIWHDQMKNAACLVPINFELNSLQREFNNFSTGC